jgi:hypothetical protein
MTKIERRILPPLAFQPHPIGPLDMGRQKQSWDEKPWGQMGYRVNKNK